MKSVANLTSQKNVRPQGVWWWYNKLNNDEYIKFCKDNNVTEIYYWCTDFNESTNVFIKSANKYNIQVYLLMNLLLSSILLDIYFLLSHFKYLERQDRT